MIDLHIHTNYSDGHNSVQEILSIAEKNKLSAISITDHNTVLAYDILKKINFKDYYSGKILSGIEMHCSFNDMVIELLGYGIDIDKIKKELQKINYPNILENIYKMQFKMLITTIKKLGIKYGGNVDYNFLKRYSTVYFFKTYIRIHEENKKFFPKEVWDNCSMFSRICMADKNSAFYFPTSKYFPSAKLIAIIIKKCGGKVFLAHPFGYGIGYNLNELKKEDKIINFISKLITEVNIDGIECFYPTFTKSQINLLAAFAKTKKLLISGGSDFHGNNPNLQLGTGINNNLNISDYILEQFNKRNFIQCTTELKNLM